MDIDRYFIDIDIERYFEKVVQEYERAVIFRLGRLLSGGAKGPGGSGHHLDQDDEDAHCSVCSRRGRSIVLRSGLKINMIMLSMWM